MTLSPAPFEKVVEDDKGTKPAFLVAAGLAGLAMVGAALWEAIRAK